MSDNIERLDLEIHRTALALTATHRSGADAAMAASQAFVAGELPTDVWYPATHRWVVVRSDGSGEYRRERPHDAESGPHLGMGERRPLSDHLWWIVEQRRSTQPMTPEKEVWLEAVRALLDQDHFLRWFPGVLRTPSPPAPANGRDRWRFLSVLANDLHEQGRVSMALMTSWMAPRS